MTKINKKIIFENFKKYLLGSFEKIGFVIKIKYN